MKHFPFSRVESLLKLAEFQHLSGPICCLRSGMNAYVRGFFHSCLLVGSFSNPSKAFFLCLSFYTAADVRWSICLWDCFHTSAETFKEYPSKVCQFFFLPTLWMRRWMSASWRQQLLRTSGGAHSRSAVVNVKGATEPWSHQCRWDVTPSGKKAEQHGLTSILAPRQLSRRRAGSWA